ncbi:MAG: hypothetical protein LBC59_09605 [Chitinispirillales bacterium]|jgi:hypothetical protein|nr:hypothetical protein [Chitinispirillales bacterium]
MKKIKMRKPHDYATVSIKKDGELYRRAVAGSVPAIILYLCANVPERWKLDLEILPVLIRMERDRWKITAGGYTYNAAAA